MSDNGVILIAALVSFLVTVGFGFLPYKTKKQMKPKLWKKLLNVFTGGMFLSLGLIHILPEAQEIYNTK
jgi:zinc transporter ZupT